MEENRKKRSEELVVCGQGDDGQSARSSVEACAQEAKFDDQEDWTK